METQDVLKKGVWKFNIAHWLMLNNCSNCLLWASTSSLTSLRHIFFEEMDKRIFLWCVNFICLVTPSEIKNYFPNPIPNSIKILLQSKTFSVKQLPVSLFGQTNKPCLLTVTPLVRKTLVKLYLMTTWHHKQTWHFFITALCHAKCMPYKFDIAGIHEFFQAILKLWPTKNGAIFGTTWYALIKIRWYFFTHTATANAILIRSPLIKFSFNAEGM